MELLSQNPLSLDIDKFFEEGGEVAEAKSMPDGKEKQGGEGGEVLVAHKTASLEDVIFAPKVCVHVETRNDLRGLNQITKYPTQYQTRTR